MTISSSTCLICQKLCNFKSKTQNLVFSNATRSPHVSFAHSLPDRSKDYLNNASLSQPAQFDYLQKIKSSALHSSLSLHNLPIELRQDSETLPGKICPCLLTRSEVRFYRLDFSLGRTNTENFEKFSAGR